MDNNANLWPGWETVRLIGQGSFGTVYEIQRRVFDDIEKAALKVISIPQNASDIDSMYSDGYDNESITNAFHDHLKNIVAEYSLMRKMSDCPNIVNCDDVRYVQHDNGIGWDIFIKMELLTPLTKVLPAEIPEETVIRLARDLCTALDMCKKHEIVHRDIKPQNIFVSADGVYKLGDFGVAKTMEKTMGGTKTGTYKYMAPEVYNNQPYGSGADIYSLGLVLYWMLNERRMPFLPLPPAKTGLSIEESARHRRLSGEPLPPPAHGSAALKRIVLKACKYDPKDRYASAAAMLQDLELLVSGGEGMVGALGADDSTILRKTNESQQPDPQAEMERLRQEQAAQAYQRKVWEEQARRRIALEEQERLQAQQTQQRKKRRPWIAFVILGMIMALILLVGYFTVHIWTDATCIEPATCIICGLEDEALGHHWEKATCDTPKTCSECGKTKGDEIGHQWIEATCTTLRTCSECGETQGDYAQHTWVEATCETAKTCKKCGSETDPPLGHDWVEATFDTPRTCSRCYTQTGDVLDKYDISIPDQIDYIKDVYYETQTAAEEGRYTHVDTGKNIRIIYDENGSLRRIIVGKGTAGLEEYSSSYRRSYYFDNGKLVFAFFDGADAHRLYFCHETLMRWRYRPVGEVSANSVNEDFTEAHLSADFYMWERLALNEAAAICSKYVD